MIDRSPDRHAGFSHTHGHFVDVKIGEQPFSDMEGQRFNQIVFFLGDRRVDMIVDRAVIDGQVQTIGHRRGLKMATHIHIHFKTLSQGPLGFLGAVMAVKNHIDQTNGVHRLLQSL